MNWPQIMTLCKVEISNQAIQHHHQQLYIGHKSTPANVEKGKIIWLAQTKDVFLRKKKNSH